MRTGLISSPEPSIPKTEREQWELAALLLEQHGAEGIVGYVADRYGLCLETDNRTELVAWQALIAKIDRMLELKDHKPD